jgi:threonine/homoserine/homoserine lactone efflux protein
MPTLHNFILFFAASVLLAITPGPGIFYVLTRTLAGGRRDGVLSSLGTFFGGLVHVFAAALGLSAILAASAVAFSIVKYAGAGYLVFLGIRMILSRRANMEPHSLAGPTGLAALRQGAITEILNPKTALFFLSFIPQFVSPDRGYLFMQFLLLGTISVTLNTSADLVVCFAASRIAARLNASAALRRKQRTATGMAMITLGGYVAFAETR